jgi:hypothetical protein
MKRLQTVFPGVLFGVGAISIGLSVVSKSASPLLVALLAGLTLGGLRQATYYFLDRVVLRWTIEDALATVIGGVLALLFFRMEVLAVPAQPELISMVIMCSLSLAHFVASSRRNTNSSLPHQS